MDKDGKEKVNEMSVLEKSVSSRAEALAKARKLSENITEKTAKAGISHEQILKDVRKAFGDVKTSRRNSDRN